MKLLSIENASIETIEQDFQRIARIFCNDYRININDHFYRLLDIEFYYFSKEKFEDPYIHCNALQKETGKWYFHESGIDITFGADGNYGGIIIRGIVKVTAAGMEDNGYVDYEIHGPLNVLKEITKKFHDAYDNSPNIFSLVDISADRKNVLYPELDLLKTNRLDLSVSTKDPNAIFHGKPYRFIKVFEKVKHQFKEKERAIKTLVKEGSITKEQAAKILGYKIDL